MLVSPKQLQDLYGSTSKAAVFAPYLSNACEAYEINTPKRLAAFLAQVGHESGCLQYVREIWGPTPAQVGYEGRKDLGNSKPGDGKLFCGRGLIQITGRTNYYALREQLSAKLEVVPCFVSTPAILETPEWGSWSACAFWDSKKLNALADLDEFDNITRRINGGQNGRTDRRNLWAKAKLVFGVV